jgi:Ca-activated chloride channel family protein
MTETPHARLESRNGGRAVFDGVRVDAQVAGMLLDVSSVQTFRNPGTRHVELAYNFPLPADAVLLSMGVRLGERQLTGKVVEKQEASGRYEDTLAEGDTAIMLEQVSDGSCCLNFGNLGPGETGEITLRYAQALRFEGTPCACASRRSSRPAMAIRCAMPAWPPTRHRYTICWSSIRSR